MEKEELFSAITSKFDTELPAFVKAIIEECCENVLSSNPPIVDSNKVPSAIIAFGVSLSILTETVKAALQEADTVTVNYRNCTEIFDKNHYLLSMPRLDFLQ